MRLRNKRLSRLLDAVAEDAAHMLIELLEVAEARLDDGEQPVLVLGQEALRLGRVKRGKLLLELLLCRGVWNYPVGSPAGSCLAGASGTRGSARYTGRAGCGEVQRTGQAVRQRNEIYRRGYRLQQGAGLPYHAYAENAKEIVTHYKPYRICYCPPRLIAGLVSPGSNSVKYRQGTGGAAWRNHLGRDP